MLSLNGSVLDEINAILSFSMCLLLWDSTMCSSSINVASGAYIVSTKLPNQSIYHVQGKEPEITMVAW